MAKELPYFQFEPAEYLTGDISFCSLSAQGLFTILCSYYWQRSCKLTKDQFLRRIKNPDEFQELVEENVIQLEDNLIRIKFLDEQLEKVKKQSKTNSINGSKGGRPKKENPKKTEIKPKQNRNETETKGIREDNIREDKIIEEEIKKEGFHNIDKIIKVYLDDAKLCDAIISNKANKIKDKKHLEELLCDFKLNLQEQGRHSETWKEFTSYFRNWAKTRPEKKDIIKKLHDNITF